MPIEVTISAGAAIPITIQPTSVDVSVLPGNGYLLGWSMRDASADNNFAIEGSVVAPGAGGVIAITSALNAEEYTVNWTVSLSGTPNIGDANNFGLYSGAVLIATSANLGAVGEYPQQSATFTVANGTTVSVKAIGAGTAGAAYTAEADGSAANVVTSAFELQDGARIVGEGSMLPGAATSSNFGSLGIRVVTGLTLHVVSGTVKGTVNMLFEKAS